MKICNKCHREYDDTLNFCSQCGNALNIKPQEYFCPFCNKLLGESFDRFCPYCGCQFGQSLSFSGLTPKTAQVNYDSTSCFNQNINYKTSIQRASGSRSYFSKEYLFSVEGRRGRAESIITWIILSILLYAVFFIGATSHNALFTYVMVIVGLIVFWAIMVNYVKRVHDFNKSGIWLLGCSFAVGLLLTFLKAISPGLQELVSFIFPFFLFFPKGTQGPNEYGDAP